MEGLPPPTEEYDDDLVPLCLPGRHPRMPAMYKASDHPLHPTNNPGNSYVFYTRPTEARMQELLQAGETIAVEAEVEIDPEAAGFLKITSGDYVWTRNEAGSRHPTDDVAVTWKFGRERRSMEKMDALDAARDKFMGPENKITEDSVRFERLNPKPKPVKPDTRCWSLGTSLEPNTNIEAPCANGKVKAGVTEYNDICHDLVVASTSLAMEDMECAPDGIKEVIKSEFDRHRMAPLGWRGNFAYHAVQCNLAYAGKSMEDQMGRADKDLVRGMQEDSFANFLRDGLWIMEDEGFIPYVGRVSYQVLRFLLLQTNERFEFDLDPVKLAKLITYSTSDGLRKSVEPWEMAPTLRGSRDPEREAEREESEKRFKELVFKHGSMIPYSFMKNEWIREEVARRYGNISGSHTNDKGGHVEGNGVEAEEGMVDGSMDCTMTDPSGNAEGSQPSSRKSLSTGSTLRRSTRKRKRMEKESDDEDEDAVRDHEHPSAGTPETTADPKRMKLSATFAYGGSMDDTGGLAGAQGLRRRQGIKKVSTVRPEDLYKLMRSLTVDALEEELLDLRNEIQAVEESEHQTEASYDELKDSLQKANNAIELGGIGRNAVKGIGSIIDDAQRLSLHMAQEANRLRSARRTLIKAQVGVRWWIEGPVADAADRAARRKRTSADGQNWVSKLTNTMVDMLVCKQASKTFRATDYGLDWGCTEAVVDNIHTGRMMFRGHEDTVREAVGMTLAVVETWVEADRHCDKKQAWFAAIVEDVMGEEALTMNVIWNLYTNLKTSHVIIGDKGYRNPTKKDMEPFRIALEGHSVNDADHREGHLYELYKQLLNQDITPSDVVKSLPSVSPRWIAMQEMIELATMYDEEEVVSSSSPYFKKLQSNPHIFHPIRESAPGRRRCRQDLLGGNHTITRPEIFSLIVWRAFPHVFSWHPDRTMLYSSTQEFLVAYKRITKTEPPAAIVEAVGRYWDMLEERRWSSFAETYPTFDQCYQHFKPNGRLESRLFPKLSRTDTFDMTCDLAYAGFCQPPSTADVARYIVMLNQGAIAGLRSLGLVDGKKRDVETRRAQVHRAMLDLGDLLKETAAYGAYETDDSECSFGLYEEGEMDPMALEHLLRTFSHAVKLL
ncbi:hypothetical protein H1R20_g2866, partial [Candolleomyces eurysporus]